MSTLAWRWRAGAHVLTQLGGSVSELGVVVVGRLGDRLDLAADVELLDALVQVGDGGMREIVRAKDGLGLAHLVDGVDVGDGDGGDGVVVARVAQCDAGALGDAERLDLRLVDVEGDGHGEEVAVGETHVVEAAVVVGLVHEALERGEAAVDDELEIAQLTLGEYELWQRVRLGAQLRRDGSIAHEQILEHTTVRSVGHVGLYVKRGMEGKMEEEGVKVVGDEAAQGRGPVDKACSVCTAGIDIFFSTVRWGQGRLGTDSPGIGNFERGPKDEASAARSRG
ncbi:hypothetical protein L1887_55048 [Cichorium endivia]|nr:hypothetical protein L1887_55048 [Cichorium endivia]